MGRSRFNNQATDITQSVINAITWQFGFACYFALFFAACLIQLVSYVHFSRATTSPRSAVFKLLNW